jgi:hypothetical protein
LYLRGAWYRITEELYRIDVDFRPIHTIIKYIATQTGFRIADTDEAADGALMLVMRPDPEDTVVNIAHNVDPT